jgi:hypothetical protein
VKTAAIPANIPVTRRRGADPIIHLLPHNRHSSAIDYPNIAHIQTGDPLLKSIERAIERLHFRKKVHETY